MYRVIEASFGEENPAGSAEPYIQTSSHAWPKLARRTKPRSAANWSGLTLPVAAVLAHAKPSRIRPVWRWRPEQWRQHQWVQGQLWAYGAFVSRLEALVQCFSREP